VTVSEREAVDVPAGGGSSVWLAGDVYTLKLPGTATGGAFTLLEAVVPLGGGPPPHVHDREDETFVVLEGELNLRVGAQEFAAPVGTVLHVPRGLRHSFRTVRATPARMLFHYAPAGMDGMLAEIGVPAGRVSCHRRLALRTSRSSCRSPTSTASRSSRREPDRASRVAWRMCRRRARPRLRLGARFGLGRADLAEQ
jgi:mannose-6-phosphate isomerase-like protein (cupin superfamily)